MEKVVNIINNFLQSNKINIEIRFTNGMFMNLKKHIKNKKHYLEIHTSGYDGTLEIKEALDWIKWTLYDYSANGFLMEN